MNPFWMKRQLALLILMMGLKGVAEDGERSTVPQAATPQPLQIVFMLGQGEMVGKGDVASAGYLLQAPLVPPREVTLNAHATMRHQPNGAYLYWQAMNAYGGPADKQQELKRLIQERADFKASFKQQVIDTLEANDGVFRGQTYTKRRGAYRGFWLFNLCDMECETVGLTPKIRALLEAPDNAFNVEAAYDQLVADANARHKKQLALNERFLKGTTSADFSAYVEAVKAYETATESKNMAIKDKRNVIAGLATTHLHLPAAERTYITGLGTIAGPAEGDAGHTASGKLTLGYGANVRSIGLEYAAGLALEQRLDAPVLIVKCAWDRPRSIGEVWRVPAHASAASDDETAAAPGWAWTRTEAHIRTVLADPGQYHPDYNPQAGFEAAGVIWAQGAHEQDNPEHAAQLASLLSDIRKTVATPNLPILCTTVGTMYFKAESDDHPVNQGLRALAAMPPFAGTVDVMDSYRWRPSELALIRSMARKRRFTPDAAMQTTLRNAGEAPFYLLAGHDAGTRLAEMIKSTKDKAGR